MRTTATLVTAVAFIAQALPATAQIITIRTVPISQTHQFDLLPSLRAGMGGVSIAVDDSLDDPFSNPAKGVRLHQGRFFASPGLYSVSNQAGAGRNLPLGGLLRSGPWFGGVALALQQLDLNRSFGGPGPINRCETCLTSETDRITATPNSVGNTYLHAVFGRVLERGFSIGGSVSWAGLHGVDGVDLLYAGSAGVQQSGHALDLRVGALKEWAGNRSVSALLLNNRFATTHDVAYLDPFWDPANQQFGQRVRTEQNLDHTDTWGLHLEYRQPLPAPGWRLGWLATTNLMSHPKLPNYQIQQVQGLPRDPGNSEAFNLGVGVSKTADGSTFGLDLIYEPIWSHTWAEAAEATTTTSGLTIPAGGKTIENRFRFSNAILRIGVAQDLLLDRSDKIAGFQLGLAVHRINYTLGQRDHVQVRSRSLDQDWIEWTPTWGLSLRFSGWEVRYRGSATHGTGRPGVLSDVVLPQADSPTTTTLVAPNSPISIGNVRVMTHQVSISFPFR